MNDHYASFVELGQVLVKEKGLAWTFAIDDEGAAVDKIGWNLTECVGDVPPPTFYLRDLGHETSALAALNKERIQASTCFRCNN